MHAMKKFKSPCLLHLLLVIFCHPVSVDISPQLPCHQTCYTYCHLTISVCHCYRHFHCHCNFHRCVIFVVYMLILLIFQCSLGTSYFTNADSNLLQFAPVERSGKSSLHPSLPRWAIFIVFALYLLLFLLQFTSVGEKKLERQPPSSDGPLRLVIVICISIIIVIVIVVFIVFVFSDLKKVGKAASLPPSSLPPSPDGPLRLPPPPAHTCWLHVGLWGADWSNNPISEYLF